MAQKMRGVTLVAEWKPRLDFVLGSKDIEGKQTYLGSKVWKNPRIEIREYDMPEPGNEEVLIEVKPCEAGEAVTIEEMFWCGQCKPCADGYPNQCEQLNEIGFNIHGGYTQYIVVPSRVVWSLAPLKRRYSGKDLFLAGSLVEPTSVAYNAVIECGGGIRPGANVGTCGGGPQGLGGAALLKTAGA